MKSDQEYILKAIELADEFESMEGHQKGWKIDEDIGGRLGTYITSSDGFWGPLEEVLAQHVLKDALAAQLTRQVDALPHVILHETKTRCFIRVKNISIGDIVRGNGREMNRIKAIVDSEVLS